MPEKLKQFLSLLSDVEGRELLDWTNSLNDPQVVSEFEEQIYDTHPILADEDATDDDSTEDEDDTEEEEDEED